MAELNAWSVTDANNNAAPPDGWPENTMQYSEVNNTGRAVQGTLRRFFGDINGSLNAGGVADAYTLTLNATYAAYFDGMYFACSIPADNTGAATINVNGIGVQSIVDRSGAALGAGDLQSGGIYEFRYDGTNFQLMGETSGGSIDASAVTLRTDINTATPPTTETVIGAYEITDLAGDDRLGQIGFPSANNTMQLRNYMHGGNILLRGEDAAGATRDTFQGDPDGPVYLYYAGGLSASTRDDGWNVVGDVAAATPPTTEAVDTKIQYFDSDSTDTLAIIGYTASNVLRFRNLMHGGNVRIEAEDNTGTVRTCFNGDPDAIAAAYYAGTLKLATQSDGVQIYTDATAPAGPTGQVGTGVFRIVDDASALLARLGFYGSSNGNLRLRNEVHSGHVELTGQNSVGTEVFVFRGDPDGVSEMYGNGVIRFVANSLDGLVQIRSDNSPGPGGTQNAWIAFEQADAVDVAEIGFNNSTTFGIRSRNHGGNVEVSGEDTGGVLRSMILANPDGVMDFFYPATETRRFRMNAGGVAELFSETSTDTEVRQIVFSHQDGTDRAAVGHEGSAIFYIRNEIHGGNVRITAEDAIGGAVQLFDGDPDGSVGIFYDGTLRLQTQAAGTVAIRSDTSTASESRKLDLEYADGTLVGFFGHNGSDVLLIDNRINSGNIQLTARDAAAAARNILIGDPDGQTTIYGDTDVVIRTVAGGENSIICNQNADVALYYNAQENFRTANEAGADIGMGAEVRHNDDTFYPVGMNVLPINSTLDSANDTLALDLVGKMLTYNVATARSLFLNNDANIPIGAMWSLIVGPSGGTLTLDGGTGVVLRYWNGTSWTDTAAAGNITAGKGQYTIWKETDTRYVVSGPNLS